MNVARDDEFLTVNEVAEWLKLNPQTVRNWIDQGQMPAVRIGRRVRIRRSDLDRILDQGATISIDGQQSANTPAEAWEQLAEAQKQAHGLLGRRSAARRSELADELQQLSDAVETVLRVIGDKPGPSNPAHPPTPIRKDRSNRATTES